MTDDIRIVARLVTGHCYLKMQLHTLDLFKENPLCILFEQEFESPEHIVVLCEAEARAYRWFIFIGIGTYLEEAVGGENSV